VDRLDDIDRALALLQQAGEMLREVELRVPGLAAEIPPDVPLHDRLAAWARMLEVALGEVAEWERALVRVRVDSLTGLTG